ncbi:MAG: hypothetical protein V9G18_06160 [Albidovulum sp.]
MNAAIAEHWRHIAPILARPVNDADLDQKIAHLDSLLDVGAEQDGHPLSGLVNILSDQIERYESERFAGYGTATGLDALKFMMAEHRLTQADLREVGTQGVVSEILAGKRKLNLRQAKALAKRSHVGLEVFVD